MEKFYTFTPSSPLASHIHSYWILERDDEVSSVERIVPTGCIQLIFYRSGHMWSLTDKTFQPRAFLGGQYNLYTDIEAAGSLSMIVIVFRPLGVKSFFDFPLSDIAQSVLSIEDMPDPIWKELEERLFEIVQPEQIISMIEYYLTRKLFSDSDYNLKRLSAAVTLVSQQSDRKVSDMAAESCLSVKQFKRLFTQYVGLQPKEFIRIMRFQRALYYMEHFPSMSFSQIAFECGYYDASHLVKEFKQLSGYTPTDFSSLSPHSDYFRKE